MSFKSNPVSANYQFFIYILVIQFSILLLVLILADDLLDRYLYGDETLNMDMVWTCVDLYREAILLTKEKDSEGEAIALSRLGSIYDKVNEPRFNP